MTTQPHTALTRAGQQSFISGSTLKLIALLTMLIDHMAVVLLERGAISNIFHGTVPHLGQIQASITALSPWEGRLILLYFVARLIGRLAFPIFCFLIAEGFTHTRSHLKYVRNLLLFAIVSEIPFDLAFNGSLWDVSYQNVFFTLCLGAMALWAIDQVEKRNIHHAFVVIPIFGAMAMGELLQSDYGAYGVILIVGLYLLRENRLHQTIFGVALNIIQATAFLAFIPIWFYNGRRGLSLKWVFYLFYPVHLLILVVIQQSLF